jgi:hypothetical protein
MRTRMQILRYTDDHGGAWIPEGEAPIKDAAEAVARAIDLLNTKGKIVVQVIKFPNGKLESSPHFGLLYEDHPRPVGI